MKHKSVAINGDDLLNRVFDDSDTPAEDVVGDTEAGIVSSWWVVTWPEHVHNPRYNSDANYRQCASEEDARENADCVYCE